MLYMLWGPQFRNPDGSPRFYEPGQARLHFQFPTGAATVEVIPEIAKLDINSVQPDLLIRVLLNLGADPDRAREVAAAVVDWRAGGPAGSLFDAYYATLVPSFRARHASIEEIEELLLVKGMTPELFHGTYGRDPQGRLTPRGGLKDCMSVYGSQGAVDVNSADPAVLAALGVSPAQVSAIVERRRALPFRNIQELQQFAAGAAAGRLQIGGGTVFTLRATAQLRLPNGTFSDVRRTASALIKFREAGVSPPLDVVRWYEN
jgi:general secretion pathway protein K